MSPAPVHETALHLACGLRLAALRAGDPAAPKLLALHGWLDNAASFEPLLPWLGTRFDVVAVDLPGHGRSDHRPPPARSDFVHWLADVQEILAALGWSRAGLLGHSLGASIALMYAGAVPEQITRIIALEGLGPLTTEAAQAPEQLAQALSERLRPSRPPRALPDLDAVVERLRRARPPTSDAALRRLAARGTRPVPGGLTFSHDPRLQGRSLLRLTEAHVHALLGRITAPVILIQASEGGALPEGLLAGRLAALRAPRTEATLAGGHHAHLDDPTAAQALLSALLAED